MSQRVECYGCGGHIGGVGKLYSEGQGIKGKEKCIDYMGNSRVRNGGCNIELRIVSQRVECYGCGGHIGVGKLNSEGQGFKEEGKCIYYMVIVGLGMGTATWS